MFPLVRLFARDQDRVRVGDLPAPVGLNGDGVCACVQQHLAGTGSGPRCCLRETNITACTAVEGDTCILCTIWAHVDDTQVIELRLRTCDGESDLISALIKALDIPSTCDEEMIQSA
jgi:hypothetical protein